MFFIVRDLAPVWTIR